MSLREPPIVSEAMSRLMRAAHKPMGMERSL